MPFELAGDWTMRDFPLWLISCSHPRLLPKNLNPGFLSTIFAFRAKNDDDFSMTGPSTVDDVAG